MTASNGASLRNALLTAVEFVVWLQSMPIDSWLAAPIACHINVVPACATKKLEPPGGPRSS